MRARRTERNERTDSSGDDLRRVDGARQRRPYVRPQVTDGEPLVNVTLLSGGANPSSQTPFVP